MATITKFFALCGLLSGLSWTCQSDSNSAVQASAPTTAVARQTAAATVVVDKAYLQGKFDPATHPDFVAVSTPYTDRTGMYMRKEAFTAYEKMYADAKKAGVSLKIISSTRTFAQQKGIWEGKWKRFAAEAPDPKTRALKILEYSSMPGSSRHHWGTDIDLNDLNNPAFEPGGQYAKVYEWLSAHAHEYGFCQPYSPKGTERPNGYNEERWHWSYTPLSKPFLQQYRTTITDDQFQGFEGADMAPAVQIVQHYVCGIREACQ
jgi:zinc D-Ala-D-Ala carboxypeptidase